MKRYFLSPESANGKALTEGKYAALSGGVFEI
jgi:hypothetical protein